MIPYATEIEYLRWFFINCDFGPAHSDVMLEMYDDFERETGTAVPIDYRED